MDAKANPRVCVKPSVRRQQKLELTKKNGIQGWMPGSAASFDAFCEAKIGASCDEIKTR